MGESNNFHNNGCGYLLLVLVGLWLTSSMLSNFSFTDTLFGFVLLVIVFIGAMFKQK
jgi:hypothetical protein